MTSNQDSDQPAALRTVGNYFCAGQVRTDLVAGVARDRAGERIITLPDELLGAMQEVLPDDLLRMVGRDLGKHLGAEWDKSLGEFGEQSAATMPMARFQAELQKAFRKFGWGVVTLDFERFAVGVVVASVRNPPTSQAATSLLGGLLAGVLSHYAGQDLDAVCAPDSNGSHQFVVSLPERLRRLAEVPERWQSLEEMISILATIRVE